MRRAQPSSSQCYSDLHYIASERVVTRELLLLRRIAVALLRKGRP